MAEIFSKKNDMKSTDEKRCSARPANKKAGLDFGSTNDDGRYKYTSLKDLLPPASHGSRHLKERGLLDAQTAHEIPLRNRLLQKAAWLYLQPGKAYQEDISPKQSLWKK